jgi:hypothetical protein
MTRPLGAAAFAAVLAACSPCLADLEVRTYQFVPDGSLPYAVSCGECAPPIVGARADVTGTFTIQFDLAAETVSFDALNTQLVNYFNLVMSPGAPILVPGTPPNFGIIPDFASQYAPPYGSGLEIHFSGDPITMYSGDGAAPSFFLFMTGNQAKLSMVVPIDDYYITVDAAKAVLIPEPVTLVVALIAAPWLSRRRMSSPV